MKNLNIIVKNNIKIVETKYSENIIQKIELNEEEYNKLISKIWKLIGSYHSK